MFQSFMPEAARNTVDYYDRASKALAEAVEQVNVVAKGRTPFNLETIPPKPFTNDTTQTIAGDGFLLVHWRSPLPAILSQSAALCP